MSEAEPFDLVAALADTARIRADCLLSTRERLRRVTAERDRLAAQLRRVEVLRDRWAEQSVTLKPTSGAPTQNATDGTLAYCALELTEYVLNDTSTDAA